jgi:hypothetical protein
MSNTWGLISNPRTTNECASVGYDMEACMRAAACANRKGEACAG